MTTDSAAQSLAADISRRLAYVHGTASGSSNPASSSVGGAGSEQERKAAEASLLADRDSERYSCADWIRVLDASSAEASGNQPSSTAGAQWFAASALESMTKHAWRRRNDLAGNAAVECASAIAKRACNARGLERFAAERLATAAMYGCVRAHPAAFPTLRAALAEHLMIMQREAQALSAGRKRCRGGDGGLDVGALLLWKNIVDECFGANCARTFAGKVPSQQLQSFKNEASTMAADAVGVMGAALQLLWDDEAGESRDVRGMACLMDAIKCTASAGLDIPCLTPEQLVCLTRIARQNGHALHMGSEDGDLMRCASALLAQCAGIEGSYVGIDNSLAVILQQLTAWCSEAKDSETVRQDVDAAYGLFAAINGILMKQLRRIEKNASLADLLAALLNEFLCLTKTAAFSEDADPELFKECLASWDYLIQHVVAAADNAEDAGSSAQGEAMLRCGALAGFLKMGLLQLADILIRSSFYCVNGARMSAISTSPDAPATRQSSSVALPELREFLEIGFTDGFMIKSEMGDYLESLFDAISHLMFIYGKDLLPICVEAATAAIGSAERALTRHSMHDAATGTMLISNFGDIKDGIGAEHVKILDSVLERGLVVFHRAHDATAHTAPSSTPLEDLEAVKHLALALSKAFLACANCLAGYWMLDPSPGAPQGLRQLRLTESVRFFTVCASSPVLDDECHMAGCSALRGCLLSWRFEAEIVDFQTAAALTATLRQQCSGLSSPGSHDAEATLWACTSLALFTFPSLMKDAEEAARLNEQMHAVATEWFSALVSAVDTTVNDVGQRGVRATRVIAAMLATCQGTSKHYRLLLYQSLIIRVFASLQASLMRMFDLQRSMAADEVAIACHVLASNLMVVRSLRAEVGAEALREYLRSILERFRNASGGPAFHNDAIVRLILMQFLELVVQEAGDVLGALLPDTLQLCETSFTFVKGATASLTLSPGNADVVHQVYFLSLSLPLRVLVHQWRHASKLARMNLINVADIIARSVTSALVDVPHPPPATVRMLATLLRDIFKAHKTIGVPQETVTAPALRAIISGHFDALNELLIDLVIVVATGDESSWQRFAGVTLCEILRGHISSAESMTAFTESVTALCATGPGDGQRRSELVELCCCLVR